MDSPLPLDAIDAGINGVVCKITGQPAARRAQITALRRLVYERRDTILIAATGFGKSAVLFAFWLLTKKITILIVPLTKLGENQRDDIAKNVEGSNPVWIDADTHLKNPKVWEQVQAGVYTHVILSPEQATNDRFKRILKSPEFHARLGLVAIDELHIVSEWREFRPEFTYLYSLRSLLPRAIPFFGCTATLDKDSQSFIIEKAGFDISQLKIIRTSVDRPEISIVLQPLLRGCLRDFRRLEFLVAGANPAATYVIPKTIIYVDNKAKLTAARYTIIRYLIDFCSFTKSEARKLIKRYDADVRSVDKDIIFDDFRREDGDCRIMAATVSMGMGMDIPDVDRVVQFGLPPSISLSDFWQRSRRAMRKKVGQGIAYFFIPYWCFDRLGSAAPVQRKPARERGRGTAPTLPSRLRAMQLAEDDGDNSDAVSIVSNADSDAPAPDAALTLETESSQNLFELGRLVKWSKSDLSQRGKLDPSVARWFNAPCFRRYILAFLQEDMDDPLLEYRRIVDPEKCCNACNNSLGKISALPVHERETMKPYQNSFADCALQLLTSWCQEKARELVPQSERRYDIVPAFWMEKKLQYRVARMMACNKKPELPFTDPASMKDMLPALAHWDFVEERGGGDALLQFCLDSIEPAHRLWIDKKKERQNKRQAGSSAEGTPARRQSRQR